MSEFNLKCKHFKIIQNTTSARFQKACEVHTASSNILFMIEFSKKMTQFPQRGLSERGNDEYIYFYQELLINHDNHNT